VDLVVFFIESPACDKYGDPFLQWVYFSLKNDKT
jgi:hypothetical protein